MKKTKYLAFCAIMSALGVVILLLGSFFNIFDLCAVLIASILIFVVCEELGNGAGMLSYVVCAVIAFLILPSKLVATEYAIFGFYPVLRRIFEARPRGVCITLKALYMVASATLTIMLVRFVFTAGEPLELHWEILTGVIGLVCLVLCDIVFKRFSRHYHTKIRKMLRIDKFFG
ncbi:MAG: hypothetical protein E7622_02655 [Ruminococcaceae bacterium]|nr:hypothetical protein [Oscillospiraceae bacterium]